MSKYSYIIECYDGRVTPVWEMQTSDFCKCNQFVQMMVQGFRRKKTETKVVILKRTKDHPYKGSIHYSELFTLNGMDSNTVKRLALLAGFCKRVSAR